MGERWKVWPAGDGFYWWRADGNDDWTPCQVGDEKGQRVAWFLDDMGPVSEFPGQWMRSWPPGRRRRWIPPVDFLAPFVLFLFGAFCLAGAATTPALMALVESAGPNWMTEPILPGSNVHHLRGTVVSSVIFTCVLAVTVGLVAVVAGLVNMTEHWGAYAKQLKGEVDGP